MLILEDNPGLAGILGRTLRERGHDTTVVHAVAAATAALEAAVFDVIVCDKRVRDGCGLEVLRCARLAAPAARRVLISGSEPEPADLDLCHDYLVKPFSLERLFHSVEAGGRPSGADSG